VGRGLAGRIAVALSIAWLAVGTIAVHPHEIAYANEVAGGPRALWTKLSDSNVDWGQALPDLAERVTREPLRRLYLGYFGTSDPAAYGLRYHTVPSMRMIRAASRTARLRREGVDRDQRHQPPRRLHGSPEGTRGCAGAP